MSTTPLVSIGIASYNNGPYLEELLDSIRAQTYPAIEIIVVDDCSPDNSVEVIEAWTARTGFPVQLVRHAKNQGIARTFSECRQLASGEFISLVGSDDVLDPHMIEVTVAEFAKRGPEYGALYSDCRLIDSQGKAIAPSFLQFYDPKFAANPPEGNLIVPLLTGFYLPALTTTIRRTALDAVGPYDETLFSEDLDMWLRLSRQFSFGYMPSVLGSYRIHDQSAIHRNRIALNETFFRIYNKRYFEGDAEWAAAKWHLADQAEHYYADGGKNAVQQLGFAWRETRQPKMAFFWLMARVGFKYKTLKRLWAR